VIPKIKRWDLTDLNDGTQDPEAWDMAEAKYGVYVEYDDHKKIVEALQAEIEKLKGGKS
jgi:hypothetical protein